MFDKIFKIVDEFTRKNKETDLGKENANFIECISVLEHLILTEINKDYLFKRIYKDLPIIEDLHNNGFIYHHQTHKLSPYCIGLSSYDIAYKGLCSNSTNERSSKPPKRIDTLLSQCANLICLLSQEVSGATSVNDLSTVCAGYLYYLDKVKSKKIDYYDLVNNWQSFLFNVNLPFRSGNSPFSNITLDFSKASASLANKTVVVGGEFLDIQYKDIPPEYFDTINRAFIDAMCIGDKLGNPFTFPLITVNITDDFDFDNECWKYFLSKSENFGGFYAQNYCTKPFNEEAKKINPYHDPYDLGMLYSNCCRMVFDIRELLGISGSNPFASNSGVGGIGVISINLNRILWLTQKDRQLTFKLLDEILELSAKALELKRQWLRSNWKSLYPYLSFYVRDDKSLFSIISVIGMHEGLKSMGYEKGIYDTEAQKFAHEISQFIRAKIDDFIKKYGSAFSLEYAPAETAACKMAQKDLDFQDLILNPDRKEDLKLFLENIQIKQNNLYNILKDCINKIFE